MAQQNTSSVEDIGGVPRDSWNAFLAYFTREYRGAHGEVEVLGVEPGHLVPVENRPFDGISADTKDGEDVVWIMFGPEPMDRVAHGVNQPTAIRFRPPTGLDGPALEIEAQDGSRTLLELSLPEEFALPPASSDKQNA